MKVYISVDMEGITGVTCWDDVSLDKPAYERFRKVMTSEVNAAVEGALAAGASAVLVNDAHGHMRNLMLEELHPRAELISGQPKPLGMMSGVGTGVDVAFCIGYHAKAGTPRAILDHTWSSTKIYALYLNGQELGELGLSAALAGHHGVPVGLVAGDLAVTKEATVLLGPAVQKVAVKEGYARSAARCLSIEEAHTRIRRAAEAAVSSPHPDPFVISSPVTLGIQFMTSLQADAVSDALPAVKRVSGRHVEQTFDDVPGALKGMVVMLALS